MIDIKYYFDKTLPFGLSYSCNLLEKFSTAPVDFGDKVFRIVCIYWMISYSLAYPSPLLAIVH